MHTVYLFQLTLRIHLRILNNVEERELVEDPAKLKELVLSKLGKASDKMKQIFEKSDVENMVCAPLRFRRPWELLWGNISKGNICVVGDALHPMTPDLGQGGCSALEESVVLARLLAEAFKGRDEEEEEERRRIRKAMEEFARERRWRSFDLIASAYFVGLMQQSEGVVMRFLRDKLMAKFLAGVMLNKASFDCGKLTVS